MILLPKIVVPNHPPDLHRRHTDLLILILDRLHRARKDVVNIRLYIRRVEHREVHQHL